MMDKETARQIRRAMKMQEEASWRLDLGCGVRAAIEVRPAPPAWAPAASLATLRTQSRYADTIQHFDRACDLEEAVKAIERRMKHVEAGLSDPRRE